MVEVRKEIRGLANSILEAHPPAFLSRDQLAEAAISQEGLRLRSKDGAELACNRYGYSFQNPLTAASFTWNYFGDFNIEGDEAFQKAKNELLAFEKRL